jgi:Lrp/AsnC family transcriptional regulator, regulator for asnA, asnC and gidA
MSGRKLDELDRTIIDVLAKDARISNRQIAAELGVTEGTIRARLKRLQQENLIRFTAVTDYSLAGSPNLVLIGIHADPGDVGRLAKQISAMPEIGCVIVMLGRFSIMAMGLFTSLEDSVEIANNRILLLPGVRRVETSVAVQTLKYDFKMAKITNTFGKAAEE